MLNKKICMAVGQAVMQTAEQNEGFRFSLCSIAKREEELAQELGELLLLFCRERRPVQGARTIRR